MKQRESIYLTLTVIGCITGVVSLGWQVYEKHMDVGEHIKLRAEFRPQQHELNSKTTFRLEVVATNLGRQDFYISELTEITSRFGDLTSPENAISAIHPGETRKYYSNEFSCQQIIEFGEYSPAELRAVTTRGRVVNEEYPIFGLLLLTRAACKVDPV